MPCIWGRHDGSQVFLGVAIVEDSFVDHPPVGGTSVETTSFNVYRGLLDTGAQSTCITSRVAREVGLAPIGKVAIHGVGGLSYHNNYLFKVAFALKLAAIGDELPQGRLHVVDKPIEGVELAVDGGNFDVLLGWTSLDWDH